MPRKNSIILYLYNPNYNTNIIRKYNILMMLLALVAYRKYIEELPIELAAYFMNTQKLDTKILYCKNREKSN